MRQEQTRHLNSCKNSSRRAVFEQQIQALEEWMDLTYTHPLLEKWLPTYLLGQEKSFQHLPNLPKATYEIHSGGAERQWMDQLCGGQGDKANQKHAGVVHGKHGHDIYSELLDERLRA